MATLATRQAQLTRVQAAIASIEENGQSITGAGGRQLIQGTYFRLLDREAWLEAEIARLSSSTQKLRGYTPVFGGHRG